MLDRYRITVRESGEHFECGGDEAVLSAMVRSRKGPISHGCFGGGCGVCRIRVLEGVFEKVKKMSRAHVSRADEDEGIVLLCCIQPRGDMTVTRQFN